MLWIGRFSPEKGPTLVIQAARRAGRRTVLAGKLNEPQEHAYFDQAVRPLLASDVEYIGEADATLKRELFGKAAVLAFPVQSEKPFGMVMVEAMARGTPVAAIGRGYVPEVVKEGVTGIVAGSAAEFPSVLERAPALSPQACRRHVEDHFDLPVMAAGYERIFRMLAEGERGPRDVPTTPTTRSA